MNTPWGKSDHREVLPNGIVSVSTPSHGGYFVPAALNAQIPEYWQQATWGGQGARGWYEEDCDWAIVCLFFAEHFPAEAYLHAVQTLKGWQKDAWARYCDNAAA